MRFPGCLSAADWFYAYVSASSVSPPLSLSLYPSATFHYVVQLMMAFPNETWTTIPHTSIEHLPPLQPLVNIKFTKTIKWFIFHVCGYDMGRNYRFELGRWYVLDRLVGVCIILAHYVKVKRWRWTSYRMAWHAMAECCECGLPDRRLGDGVCVLLCTSSFHMFIMMMMMFVHI